jgi:soluble lytic murein transglycosylase-like protein
VQELGLYRRLSAEEKLIHNTARVFRESEFSMPAGFVREVRQMIDTYWLGPGRARYTQAVARAQENGYVEPIVEALMRRGLPPELFYLALQESDFRVDAIGPRTRWGIAKGMWQFIPSTARRFGLAIGPREDDRVVDPDDERHDFRKATDAAARYLQTIYTTDAQASGLLVVASYNWGEHRVNRKLNQMPAGIPEEALKGLDATPDARNYWRFLTEYRNRMPQETRDYVLRVFAAAVIGQDPRHFGFDFDDPLQAAIESAGARLVSTATPPSAS